VHLSANGVIRRVMKMPGHNGVASVSTFRKFNDLCVGHESASCVSIKTIVVI
jgi:hypothetical protein